MLKEPRGAMQDISLHWNQKKVLSGTRDAGSPSARRVWYEDERDNYHHDSWGRKTLQIPWGARERLTG